MADITYAAVARKDGRWWTVEVPALDVTGQARSLSEVQDVAQEIAGLVLDVDPTEVRVEINVGLPEELEAKWRAARERASRAAAEQLAAAAESRAVVHALRDQKWTYKEAAAALGLSEQRVHRIEQANGRELTPA
ncbi:DNA-directed RNA polymerase specialized sigma24 family protein [Curtobacterium flaccumfaciens]|jgi:DNA-directed RNA polymerase specialized sigma24 family protein|uniref:DNA-directed RNA polymerase specialized sigma24 family protein n=1 Tax=Curtobacterium salicis TaxID=1779862 RepID=A0ABX0T902_9MICO|nr:sigma factor-like helix-turn-helix DNA-binding protein [Curtobacterium sp. WW7]NII41474.1 DNA-directed RNA polymerase specialized sigma24 family protein [Curtobacterium sp. WW7]